MLTKTVFVIEDEPDLLDLVTELLTMENYSVISASSAEQALEIWKKNSEKIDLLLTDLTLPGNLNGVALVEKFQIEKPLLKSIFSSGHPLEMAEKKFAMPPGSNFLQKPFSPDVLWRTVRTVLNS